MGSIKSNPPSNPKLRRKAQSTKELQIRLSPRSINLQHPFHPAIPEPIKPKSSPCLFQTLLLLPLLSLTSALTHNLSKRDLAPTSCNAYNTRAYCENEHTVKLCTHEQDGHGRPVGGGRYCGDGRTCSWMINGGKVACEGVSLGSDFGSGEVGMVLTFCRMIMGICGDIVS